MLDIIRNLVSSIFGKILLAIMVLSFALWGVGDILSSGNSQLAAKVGEEKITLDEFYVSFQETVRNYNDNMGSNLTLKGAYEIQLHNLLLQDLIYTKMVNDYAKKRGIYLNDESLKIIITELPEFKNNKNIFSNTKYKTFILNNFATEDIFLKEIENTIFQSLIFENFNINNFINNSIIDLLFMFEGEKRSVSYFILEKDKIEESINDDLLNDYYLNNQITYLIPEKTIVDVIEIDLENFTDLDNITNDMALEYYSENIDDYSKDESRDIKFIRFSNEIDANKFYGHFSKKDNSNLENYMKENNLNFSSISNFTGGTFSNEITKEIFKLDENIFSKPINYNDFGYYIFRINNINKKEITQFNSIKNEIINDLALELAYVDFDDAVNIVDEMLINDYSFEEIVNTQSNLEVNREIDLEELKMKFGEEYFSSSSDMPMGFVSEIIIKENSAIIYKIKEKKKSYIPELSEIREKVSIDYNRDQQNKNLINKAETILKSKSFRNLDSFEEFAISKNAKVQKLNKVSRTNSELSDETLQEIFNSEIMRPFKFLKTDGTVGIGVVSKIMSPEDQISDEFYNTVKNNINNNFNSSLSEIIASEIIGKSSYEIYSKNIDQLFM